MSAVGALRFTMTTSDAPLKRAWLDDAGPILRLLFGAGFVAYSAYATVFLAADDLQRYFKMGDQATLGFFADRYWLSTLLALVLFLGEVATGERYRKVYWLFLAPDAIYTARQAQPGWDSFWREVIGDRPETAGTAAVLSWIVALIIGYLVARWGEDLLFGRRRRTRGAARKGKEA